MAKVLEYSGSRCDIAPLLRACCPPHRELSSSLIMDRDHVLDAAWFYWIGLADVGVRRPLALVRVLQLNGTAAGDLASDAIAFELTS